jgi:hypothetical protein
MIHSTTSLVLVDILAQNKKTGVPIRDFQKDDFLVRDDGKPAQITVFNRAADQNLRPMELWFVLICNEERHYEAAAGRGSRGRGAGSSGPNSFVEDWGSSFLAGKAADLRPVLDRLRAGESVGVAHWCDDGESEVDVPPSQNYAEALRAMDEIAGRKSKVVQQASGKNPREQVLRLINHVAQAAFPEPFVALIFVGGKQSAPGAGDLRDAWSGSMEISSMELGPEGTSGSGETAGPAAFAVHSKDYATRLGTFIDLLHNRHEIGFQPGRQGKKPHYVSVTLTKSAKDSQPDALLRYRDVYSDELQPADAEAAKPMAGWTLLDSRMQAAVKSSQNLDQLPFRVTETHDPAQNTFRFVVSIAPDKMTWKMLPNGDRRTVVTTVVASYSEKGQPIQVVVKELEIVQTFDRLQALKDKPVMFSVNTSIAKGAAKFRLVVRDVATGHIGSQDLLSVADTHP